MSYAFGQWEGHKTAHELHLKVLVVVRIEAETGDEAVHHKLHIGVLAAGPPPEGFGWIEQQRLVGREGKPWVTHENPSSPLTSDQWNFPLSLLFFLK